MKSKNIILHIRASTTIGIASEILRLSLCRAILFSKEITLIRVGWPFFFDKKEYPEVLYHVLTNARLFNAVGWHYQIERFTTLCVQILEFIKTRMRLTTSIKVNFPLGQEGLYFNSPEIFYKISGLTNFARLRRVARAVRNFGVVDLKTLYDKKCRQDIIEIGINPGDWFVCLHVRTSHFHQDNAKYRNANFKNYEKAIDYIIQMGGKVVRMGDTCHDFIPFKRPNLIDYPNTKIKSELMDLYLIKNCRFYIGTLSGILDTAYLLGTPTLCVNSLHFDMRSSNPKDRMLYKHIVNKDTKKILTFNQAMKEFNNILSSNWQEFYEVNENTTDEILLATKEFIEVICNNVKPTMRQVKAKKIIVNKRLEFAEQNGNLWSMVTASIAFSRCHICDFSLVD
jgi:putative glycosyltransferase (TIGR04372 family)